MKGRKKEIGGGKWGRSSVLVYRRLSWTQDISYLCVFLLVVSREYKKDCRVDSLAITLFSYFISNIPCIVRR